MNDLICIQNDSRACNIYSSQQNCDVRGVFMGCWWADCLITEWTHEREKLAIFVLAAYGTAVVRVEPHIYTYIIQRPIV